MTKLSDSSENQDINSLQNEISVLKEQLSNMQTLLDNSGDFIWSIDKNLHLLAFNNNFEKMIFSGFGKKIEKGDFFLNLLPDSLKPLWKERYERVFNGESFIVEEQHQMNQKSAFVQIRMDPIKEGESVIGISVYSKDISNLKKQEAELDSLARLPSENPDPTIRVFKDGTIINSNSSGEMLLSCWKTNVGEYLPDNLVIEVLNVLNSGDRSEFEVKCEGQIFSLTFFPVIEKEYVNIYAKDISERKEAEIALRESEERLTAIMEAAVNVSFVLTDASETDPLIIEFSPGAEIMFGYKKIEMIGRSVGMLYQKEDIKIFPSLHKDMKTKGEGFFSEIYQVRKNGEVFPASLSTFPIFNEKNELYAILLVSIDITEQKKSEKLLIESEERYRTLVDTSPIPILVFSNELVTFINPVAIKVLGGRNKDDFICKPIEKIIHADFLDYYNGHEIPLEQRFICVDGTEIDVEVRNNSIDFFGDPSFQLVFQDISEKKKAELALVESEKKFRSIYNSTHDAIVILNIEGRFIEVNQAACHYLGYTKEEFLSLRFQEIFLNQYVPGDWKKRVNEVMNNFNSVREVEMYSKSGVVLNVELSSRIIDYNGEKAMLSIAREISERKNIERKILNAIIDTEERERERFARDLHDGLGPLLSSIKLYLKVIAKANDEEKEEVVRDAYEVLSEAINSIKTISNNLSPHILNDFGLVAAIKAFCKKITIPDYLKITFDSSLADTRFNKNIEVILYRIVKELVNNSLKHASANRITIDLHQRENVIQLIYKDNGVGFDKESVFNKDSEGLGFFSIRNRLRSINGKMIIDSALGKGINIKVIVILNE